MVFGHMVFEHMVFERMVFEHMVFEQMIVDQIWIGAGLPVGLKWQLGDWQLRDDVTNDL